MKKKIILETICYAFVLLFVYTALSKWFMYRIYLYDLNRSPELGNYAKAISILIPLSELTISALLLFDRTRRVGLLGAFILMILFTIYVTWVVFYAPTRPCTCGGIIRELSWRNHLIFNIVFTSMAGLGLWLTRKNRMDEPKNRQWAL